MPFPFDLTEEATADLEEAISYIAADSVRAAIKIADQLESTLHFLADWPETGHRRQDLTENDELRFWTAGRYLIAYFPNTRPILIIAVFHGSRDVKSLLPRRLELL